MRLLHCGYPIDKSNHLSEPADDNLQYNEDTIEDENESPLVSPGENRKPQSLPIIIGVTLTILLIVSCILFVKKNIINLPYGIKPGMTISEVTETMSNNGFVYNFTSENEKSVFFKGRNVYGVKTDFSVIDVWPVNSKWHINIKHFYEKISENSYQVLKESLSKQYGEPRYGNVWERGNLTITLDYDPADMTTIIFVYN